MISLTRTAMAVVAMFCFLALVTATAATAATITADQDAGNPLASGSVFAFDATIGANTPFVESIFFQTDGTAALGSLSVLGLELAGVLGFAGDFTLSLYEGVLAAGATTDPADLVATTTGTALSNVAIAPNAAYSFVIEGLGGPGLANTLVGAVGVSEVPLPAAGWLLGSALLGLIAVARRRSLASAVA